MTPLEKLHAAANRLEQLAAAPYARNIGDRLRSDAGIIRRAAMEIRNALAATAGRSQHPKFALIIGDESGKQEVS